MRKQMVVGSALIVTLLAGGLLFGEQQQPGAKAKGRLPAYWSKLGLSDEQKKRAYAITTEYQDKIDALRRDIAKLQEDERRDLGKILTDPQRDELKKLIATKAGEAPAEEKKPTDAKKPKDANKPGGQ